MLLLLKSIHKVHTNQITFSSKNCFKKVASQKALLTFNKLQNPWPLQRLLGSRTSQSPRLLEGLLVIRFETYDLFTTCVGAGIYSSPTKVTYPFIHVIKQLYSQLWGLIMFLAWEDSSVCNKWGPTEKSPVIRHASHDSLTLSFFFFFYCRKCNYCVNQQKILNNM